MRRFICLFFVLLLPLWLGSWFDPLRSDQFSGRIYYSDETLSPVSHLSGSATFVLSDYKDLIGKEVSGELINLSGNTLFGFMDFDDTQYNIRFQARSGLQVEQSYLQNGVTRTSWVSYRLLPDDAPSSLSSSELCLIFVSVSVFFLAGFYILSREVI